MCIRDSITPNSSFQCNGYADIGGYRIWCHLHSGHGNINIEQIMAQSCNMGVIQIANLLGADKFYEYQREFGFGDYTGIDLPGEATGQLHAKEAIGPTAVSYTHLDVYKRQTHTSVAILDALKAVNLPAVEVHLSDVGSREDFRQISYAGMACEKTITGKGFQGYIEALVYLKEKYQK